jgi:NAD(P)-dependent dehydrogenase (short-subunit alcohol dehydrogenase family)
MVPVLPRVAAVKLSPDASYLIVGGNGGLGQSVAHWLVSRGARNLVLLSRSAAKSEKTAALAEELREAGCGRVLRVSCDVASEDDLARAIDTCAQEGLPPIRGVIHAAFVLRVSKLVFLPPFSAIFLQQSSNPIFFVSTGLFC